MHLQHIICPFNKCFHHKTGLSQTSQLLFMFQCNEHVEMDKFLCSLACTWMTIIDSQVILLTAYRKMFRWNEMLTWWLPGCTFECVRSEGSGKTAQMCSLLSALTGHLCNMYINPIPLILFLLT